MYKYDTVSEKMAIDSLKDAYIILAGGNGGSAEQSSHFIAELTGSFEGNMSAFPAMSMCANTAEITAFANDFGYENIFVRYCDAFAGLVPHYLFITTSGTSKNVVNAIKHLIFEYDYPGYKIILLTGKGDKIEPKFISYGINIIRCYYESTAQIQECHMHILHNIAKGIKFE